MNLNDALALFMVVPDNTVRLLFVQGETGGVAAISAASAHMGPSSSNVKSTLEHVIVGAL
jgi:hypothetical protein